MANDATKLVIALEAQSKKMQNQLVAASKQIDRFASQTERRFDQMQKRSENSFSQLSKRVSGSFAGIGRAIAGAVTITAAQRLIDASTRIENSLKVAGLAGEELTKVYDKLFVSAQKNAAPLEALVDLYSRASLVQKELGISTEELLGFTDNVALALRVSGKSAQESSGALLQLSQALGSGTVRAEEFNSILEGALPIAQAAAVGLKEAGGSVAKLRALVVDGKVSSEAFFRAFEAGSVTLVDKVSKAELTVSQGFVRLQNVLTDAAGKFDDATGASAALGGGLDGLSSLIEKVGEAFRDNKPYIQAFFGEIREQAAQTSEFLKGKAQPNGETTFFDPVDPQQIQNFISGIFGGSTGGRNQALDQRLGSLPVPVVDVTPGSLPVPASAVPTPTRVRVVNKPAGATDPNLRAFREADAASLAALNAPKTVSLDDYKPPGTGSKSKTPGQKLDDDIAAQKRKNDFLREETALRAALNPLVNDYGYAIEKLKVQQELENAAVAAGLQLTPARKEAIAAVAEGYAAATVEAEKLTEAQDKAAKSMEDWFAFGKDAARGFIDDLVAGKSAAEALGGVFDKLADKLLDIGLGGLFGSGGGDFGAIGSLFGFASGTANTGGVRGQARGIVHGQEAVIPLPNGGKVPVDVRMPSSNSSSGAIAISVSVGVQNGELVPLIAQVSGEVAGRQIDQRTPAIVRQVAPGAVSIANRNRTG